MKSYPFIFLLFLGASFFLKLNAQVGINNNDPHPSSILDIRAETKGILLPRLDDGRTNIQPDGDTVQGLLYYEKSDNRFYFSNGKGWQCLSPLNASDSNEIEAPQNLTVRNNLTVKNNLRVNNVIEGHGTIPIGGIIMYNGTTPPDGWVFCDGIEYKCSDSILRRAPDLRGRFIVGYSNNPDVDTEDPEYINDESENSEAALSSYNSTGKPYGDRSTKLNVSNLPSHGHDATIQDYTHLHSKGTLGGTATVTNSTHKHEVPGSEGAGKENYGFNYARGKNDDHNTEKDGAHTHTLSISGNTANSTNKPTITVKKTGSGTLFSNLPPYYVLAFIMRIK